MAVGAVSSSGCACETAAWQLVERSGGGGDCQPQQLRCRSTATSLLPSTPPPSCTSPPPSSPPPCSASVSLCFPPSCSRILNHLCEWGAQWRQFIIIRIDLECAPKVGNNNSNNNKPFFVAFFAFSCSFAAFAVGGKSMMNSEFDEFTQMLSLILYTHTCTHSYTHTHTICMQPYSG